MPTPLYVKLARAVQALQHLNNKDVAQPDLEHRWETHLTELEALLPSGSGFDSGCVVNRERSRADRLVIVAPFHPMDQNGSYLSWRQYRVIITPSLTNYFDMEVTGKYPKDADGVREYIADTFQAALTRETDLRVDTSGLCQTTNAQ
ncbi:hypothetical protein [Pantanalinema sp. GBBB05]|uniref:hypothetical protein n=1 Tax=Pantanalinema sp. GBBB05 TaxID=2604139 RepID=UPI001DAC6160|nr:hypothetical protein [Pantanalinema sp. GBBB05]